ncbi:MAG: 50S ribosomal protein L11 methyltransferase, partial [Oscillospiraceae bacterium]|nr:50S ribosomal protein L11 methyltransferase [Oscillospiraceae bacterium]
MNWTEVNIFTTTEGIDPVCGCLLGIGVTGFVIKDAKDFEEFLADKTGNWDYIDDDLMNLRNCETCVTVYLPDDSQGADMLSALRSEMSALAARDENKAFGRLTVELANVCEEDWANNWKQYFKPLTVGEKLVIKPSWEDYDKNDSRTILEIDPASSFGTGQHNTTQLCLELIEKNLKGGDKVLDLGCGSGILSIAAILLGAEEVTAVDISQNSVETAKENAAKNNISESKYTAYCGDIISNEKLVEKIGGGFDLIAANIVADVLIAMSPLFEKFVKKGGTLILSGIITERADEV